MFIPARSFLDRMAGWSLVVSRFESPLLVGSNRPRV